MSTSMNTSKDTILMSALFVVGFAMATLGPLLASPDAHAAVNSSSGVAQSVWTPAAMQPILHREAAIIVTAPRISTARAIV